MANDGSERGGGGGLFGRLTTLATLLQTGRAFRKSNTGRALRKINTGRAALLVGSVLIGRRNPRLGYLLQLADTANRIRRRLA